MSNEIFYAEAQDLLQNSERTLLDLGERPHDRPLIDELFRYIHTIKGGASIFGFDCMVQFLHLFENILDQCRQDLQLNAQLISLFFDCKDLTSTILAEIQLLPQNGDPIPSQALSPETQARMALLSGHLSQHQRAAATAALPPAHEVFSGIFLFEDEPTDAPQPSNPAPRELTTTAPSPSPPAPTAPTASTSAAQLTRVKSEYLDQFTELITELVTSAEKARLHGLRVRDAALREALEEQIQLLERIHDTTLNLRMAEVGETFQHLRRLVQRLNGELHKDVRLEISGQDIEIDKTILERITNPLTHLLRNSMDHGIETPQERIAAGKPPQGVIRLSAYHEVGAAVIEILDDGRGINRERLLEKARTRGIDVGNLRPQDKGTLDLIFHPGLSTSETVSNVSGRGVGMDVVKKTVEAMRGKLSVHSEPGRGTRITLRLPVTMALTMALIRGLQVRVDDVCIIIPMEEILTCGELLANTLHGEGVTGYLEHLGQRIPYIHLGRYLKRAPQTAPRLKMAIVQQGQQPIALLVHELQSEHQTVIKPMGPLLSTHPCFNGASILGDGTVAMVLNTNSLLDKISNNLQDAA